MTLREFTKTYLPLPDANSEGEAPIWRKVFPTELRFHKIALRQPTYKRDWITGYMVEDKPAVYQTELEEQWERVHKGEIIDREWRKVPTY